MGHRHRAGAGVMRAILAGVSPADPMVFGLAVAIALMVAAAGGLRPALRAVRTDPTIAMREE